MDAEALFLESRRERQENQAQRHVQNQKIQQKRQHVLHILKTKLKEWTCELEKLSKNASAESEEEKKVLRMHFATHEDKLKQLRKQCLSTDSLSSLWHILDQSSSHDEDEDNDEIVTVADFGILHSLFSECQSRLERSRMEKLPRGKFLFKRYRLALENKNNSGRQLEISVSNARTTPIKSRSKRLDPQRTLSDLQDVNRIVVHSDGSIEGIEMLQPLAASPASLVLHNIKRCSIELYVHFVS